MRVPRLDAIFCAILSLLIVLTTGEAGKAKDLFEYLDDVASLVPTFGGMFWDEQEAIHIYLTDLAQEGAALAAIKEVFNPVSPIIVAAVVLQKIQILQGQYGLLQLREWSNRLKYLRRIPGIVGAGIGWEANRVRVLVEDVEFMRPKVGAELSKQNIPLEAVILEKTEWMNYRAPRVPQPKLGPSCAQLETDQAVYESGDSVTITLVNNCDHPVYFGFAPWEIFDARGRLYVYRVCSIPYTPNCGIPAVLLGLGTGEQRSWTWDQKGGEYDQQLPGGTYIVEMDVSLDTRLSENVLYTTSFSIQADESISLNEFDTNKNNKIDDSEFFKILDAWISEQIDDYTFFAAIDLWALQRTFSSASLDSHPTKLDERMLTIHLTEQAVTFRVQEPGITTLGVEIYDLSGHRVLAQETSSRQLVWNLNTGGGYVVSNGVYLYVATVRTMDGRALRSEAKKLVVLR